MDSTGLKNQENFDDSSDHPKHRQAETYLRSFNHLVNDEADNNLFQETFQTKQTTMENYDLNLNSTNNRTGVVWYDNCVDHYCLWDETFEENPQRFTYTFDRLNELGLIDKCHKIEPRKATEQELALIHSEEYIQRIANICSNSDPNILEQEAAKYDAVYFNPDSYKCALYAAGSTIELVDNLMRGEIRNGMALVRPPGHHAMKSEACGYCIFNNVAIAAYHCIKKYKLKKVLIVDWDVHHGQATQRSFYNDDRVLYVSMHRYQNGSFWPELIESNYNFIGENHARGFNINVPLNETGLMDTDYLAIWHNLLLPIFYEFNPELVLVSAGYDAAIGCPQGEMLLTPAVYSHFTHYLMGLANGKLGIIMEGGYCIESLADGIVCTMQTLLGEPPLPLKMRYPINKSVVESILNVISVLRSCWDILKLQRTFDRHETEDRDGDHRKRHYPSLDYQGLLEFLPEKPQTYPTRDVCPIQSDEDKERFLGVIMALRDKVSQDRYNHSYSKKRTCIITMPEIADLHKAPKTHPERPNRTKFAWKLLQNLNILDSCYIIEDNKRSATEEQILKCHSKEMIETIKSTEHKSSSDLRKYEKQYDSIYFTKDSFKVAKLAAGALLQVVDCVVKGDCLNGFALIRPPGHHAGRDASAGFCLFNNVCIAAHYATEEFGLKRILIVDWDVHHGDGIHDIVKNDDRFLYISIHRYDHAQYYPEKLSSNYSVGSKNIINIPWNSGPFGDKEYLATFFNIILPLAHNFNPDLVFVSSGFDAATGDPLGEFNLSPEAFGQMTHLLCSLANGKVIMALEGGYNLKSIANSTLKCVLALLGHPPKPLKWEDVELDDNSVETMINVIGYHSDQWPCLAFDYDLPESKI